ncbi:MAG: hypothetical protein WC980_00430 [Candidatus Brocadiia bacterium]
MKHSITTGFSFGSTSGVITTLGLMVGLHSGTHSKMAVLGGILTIAIADAFSDALGIHISEESENTHTQAEIWVATISTFIAKFIVALTFVVPILLWEFSKTFTIPLTDITMPIAILVAVAWGLLLITMVSLRMAKAQGSKASHVILEHVIIVIVVIFISHFVGDWSRTLG